MLLERRQASWLLPVLLERLTAATKPTTRRDAMKQSIRRNVLAAVAVLSLAAAGFAVAKPSHPTGKPSTTPPPWSHGGGHGHAGNPPGKSK
jgi:hypothetical protein